MSSYILIHGACSGGWCWEKVVPLLERAGHTVAAPDLPGHGLDDTPSGEVTLASYSRRVCEILDAQAEPVILVGYSMSGLVITAAAEERPEKIKALVYLTAYLVRHGESLAQVINRNTHSLRRNHFKWRWFGEESKSRFFVGQYGAGRKVRFLVRQCA